MRARRLWDLPERFAQERDRVVHAAERMPSEKGVLDQLSTTVPEGEQMSGKVTAVHRGDILGIERTKFERVVPIVEVSAKQFELTHGLEGGFQSLNGVYCT